jgi:amino-acid N-acetyltransferase
MTKIQIRAAVKYDMDAIKSLLDSASLPSVDIEKHLLNFLVLEERAKIAGIIGIELYGDTALLRSLAVTKEYRGKGFGKELCSALISNAKKMNVKSIYLLTETAEGFFRKQGFQKIERDVVPDVIKQTYEYSSLCPEGAVCMVKKLG